MRALLERTEAVNANALQHITLSERWALRHAEHRLRAEIAWLEQLVTAAPEIIADQREGPHPRRS